MPQATLVLQQKLSYHPQGKNMQIEHIVKRASYKQGVDTTNAHWLKMAIKLESVNTSVSLKNANIFLLMNVSFFFFFLSFFFFSFFLSNFEKYWEKSFNACDHSRWNKWLRIQVLSVPMLLWKLSACEFPLNNRLTSNCLIETCTKLGKLILAVIVSMWTN